MFGSFFKGGSGLNLAFRVGTIGVHMVVCTFVGLVVGYYLDKYFETAPWLMLIFLGLGIAAGFKNLYSETKRILNDKGQDGSNDRENKPKT